MTYESWRKKKEYCKRNEVYPVGNLTLSNKRLACTESMQNDSSPRWVGILKDFYQSEEQGIYKFFFQFLSIFAFRFCQGWMVESQAIVFLF